MPKALRRKYDEAGNVVLPSFKTLAEIAAARSRAE